MVLRNKNLIFRKRNQTKSGELHLKLLTRFKMTDKNQKKNYGENKKKRINIDLQKVA